MTDEIVAADIEEFILAQIDSIAQLEALLLLRASPGEAWDSAKAARRLYVSERESHDVLERLCAEGLLSGSDGGYRDDGDARGAGDRRGLARAARHEPEEGDAEACAEQRRGADHVDDLRLSRGGS